VVEGGVGPGEVLGSLPTGTLNLTLPLGSRVISGVVPPGSDNLSVFAVNPCGSGVETVPQSVTVP
jgi:hypothetical protein